MRGNRRGEDIREGIGEEQRKRGNSRRIEERKEISD
jgi:hypothetical protein